MRDLTMQEFSSNSPMRNYILLRERIESMESRVRQLEQAVIECLVKLNGG